ncbi:MAG TPA: lysylphosphatidylglycerol synthase transmembrane domain-containing protein [Candidatus Saccharimonadales bacterium]|jgi:hypothetical protein|nr:lysylphosphatidylglycerol synthase transmembrane domain-containing protein [Candidatus Saccharimonadales bacterium]
MKFRTWLSIVTALAIVLIVFFSRHELLQAWELLGRVNVWILILIIPAQFLSYYAVGAMILDYLRAKGELVKFGGWQMARVALELNFVNHTLPSGGVSGISYMNWRLKHLGVSTGRATLAQAVRFMASFGAYLVLLLIALIFMTIDGNVSRFTILVSAILGTSIIFGTLFVIYIISSESRLQSFSHGLSRTINGFGRKIIRRRKQLVSQANIEKVFVDLHADYLEIRRDPKVLKKPILWAFVFNLSELAMFMLAFAALGSWVNPAPLLIAYGVAGLAGLLVITPGGAGAYEALMISFLASAGVVQDVAIAGILLARVTLMLGTIISGYIFYQLTLLRYGKNSPQRQ